MLHKLLIGGPGIIYVIIVAGVCRGGNRFRGRDER